MSRESMLSTAELVWHLGGDDTHCLRSMPFGRDIVRED
jgi:hypothetical protein